MSDPAFCQVLQDIKRNSSVRFRSEGDEGSEGEENVSPHLHVGLQIVFASTAKGTQGTLVAFQARVDDHVSLPVALALDDQSTHRTLEWFPAILRRALRTPDNTLTFTRKQSVREHTFRK